MALQTHENRRTNYRLQKRHRRLRRRTLSKKSSRPILLPRTLGTKNRTIMGRGDRHAVPVCSISLGEINILAEFHHSSLYNHFLYLSGSGRRACPSVPSCSSYDAFGYACYSG